MIIVPLVLFVCLIGVGIVIPLFPFFGQRIGASAELITVLIAVFSFGQFVSSPFWGWLSDKIGRKPVLVFSLFGSAASFVVLALADSIETLLLSRVVGGLMTGIAPVAFAIASDVSTPAERGRAMARIGIAFSLGFIAGPVIGGLMAGNDIENANYFVIGMTAAAMSVLAALITIFGFKETLPKSKRLALHNHHEPQSSPLAALAEAWRLPGLRRITVINFCFSGAMGIFDSTFALFANARISSGPETIGFLFAMLGLVGALFQAVAVSRVATRLGEWGTVLLAVTLYIVGVLLLGSADRMGMLIVALVILAMAYGLFIPTSNSIASKASAEGQRGSALGVFQGAANLARSLTPLFSGYLFAKLSIQAPFLVASVLLILPLLIAMRQIRRPI